MANDSIPEEWRPVEGWPYEVSSLGRVRRSASAPRKRGTTAGRLRRPWIDRDGYLCVSLKEMPRRETARVHRLVAHAFLGRPPTSDHVVAHGDGDKQNNALVNLRWATVHENVIDTVRHGRSTRGSRHGRAKLTESQVLEIRRLAASGTISQRAIATAFSVSNQLVANIVHRHCWEWLDAPSDGR